MIRTCDERDFELIWEIINDGAQAYRGIIPADCWNEPYMSREKLAHELAHGVAFWGWEDGGRLVGVMGQQQVRDVILIRHAYVRTIQQGSGVGGRLLRHVQKYAGSPILVGAWVDAVWAIRFYERHGFRLVEATHKDRLLEEYWTVPRRQSEVSVVLADEAAWPLIHSGG